MIPKDFGGAANVGHLPNQVILSLLAHADIHIRTRDDCADRLGRERSLPRGHRGIYRSKERSGSTMEPVGRCNWVERVGHRLTLAVEKDRFA
jgi:hypothetical protein